MIDLKLTILTITLNVNGLKNHQLKDKDYHVGKIQNQDSTIYCL